MVLVETLGYCKTCKRGRQDLHKSRWRKHTSLFTTEGDTLRPPGGEKGSVEGNRVWPQ